MLPKETFFAIAKTPEENSSAIPDSVIAKYKADVAAYNAAITARRSGKANIQATFDAAMAAAKTNKEKKAANDAAKAATAALPTVPPKPVQPPKP